MTAFFAKSWEAAISAFVGVVLALMFIPLITIGWQQMYELYDKNNPPVSARLATYGFDDGGRLYLRFYVTRHEDCSFLKMHGFTGPNSLEMQPSTVRRLDGEQPIDYPAGITVLSNTWVLYPVHGIHTHLQGYYECGTRIVKTTLIKQDIGSNEQD